MLEVDVAAAEHADDLRAGFCLDAPLEQSMLYTEASWENRAQMSKTSARDFAEAVLLDAHHAQWLGKNGGQRSGSSGSNRRGRLP